VAGDPHGAVGEAVTSTQHPGPTTPKADAPRHPFPPVVRWLIHPVAAATAGLAAGAASAWVTSGRVWADLPVMGAGLGAGTALAFALFRRPWAALAAAPVLGPAGLCVAYTFFDALLHARPAGLLHFVQLIVKDRDIVLFVVLALLQAGAALPFLPGARPRPVPLRVLPVLALAFVGTFLGATWQGRPERLLVSVFCGAGILLQPFPLWASNVLAQRLRM
jgi:hypothetical protein